MASADLRDELNCSICLNLYTDPVTLGCDHNFCQVCIGDVLDTQQRSGVYSCPECRAEYQDRPALQRNRKLCNIVERFLSTHPEQEETTIFCTYCIHSPVPAVKSCLHCEASLCDKHLRVHNKSVEHVITEPTASLGNRKCSLHKKLLEYYCSDDNACVCMSCCLIGNHKGHNVESLNEACEKKKEKLRNVLEKLTSTREKAEKRVHNLQKHCKKRLEESAAVRERVTDLIRDIREQLEALEKRALREISRHEEQVSLQVSDRIQKLEIKKDKLSRKIHHIEKLYNVTDPLTVLQGQESDRAEYSDTEEGDDKDTERGVGELDEGLISLTLHRKLADIVTDFRTKTLVHMGEESDILLDVNTASNSLALSDDLKTVSSTDIDQNRPNIPERFSFRHVLSTRSFSSGRHFWEVDTSKSSRCSVGVAYPSIERKTPDSFRKSNTKYWGLEKSDFMSFLKWFTEKHDFHCQKLGIYLDYDAGRLSCYKLSDKIRHLRTFTATFTEPLHVALSVYSGSVTIRSLEF
ncbi:E3 ubiquitin/ISG15 ligase TRIM25-like [Rhinophrynus dorsalis]